MQITIEYAAQVKRAAGVASEILELDESCTAQEAIHRAVDRHDEALKKMLVDADGKLQRSILVFVGEDQMRWDDEARLKDGDTITLLSPISGG